MRQSLREGPVLLGAAAVAWLAAGAALADSAHESEGTRSVVPIALEASIGVLEGSAHEYVYAPSEGGRTLSRLDWTFDAVPVLEGALTWTPYSWMALAVAARTDLDGDSTMDDYDFNLIGCPPSGSGSLCHSHHDDTRLDHARRLDVGAAVRVAEIAGVRLSGLAGYRWEDYKWSAYGGSSNYAGDFPANELAITYEQWWRAPYLGLAAQGERGHFHFSGRVTGSVWAEAHDEDNHHMRTLLFTEEFNRSEMIQAGVRAGYELSPQWMATATYDFERWSLAKGPTKIIDYSTGDVSFFSGDSAGASAVTHTLSAGLLHRF